MTFGPIESYVLHRPPMLLLDEVIEVTPSLVRCLARIRPDSPFLDGGVFAPTLLVDMAAQALFVYYTCTSNQDGATRLPAFPTGIRNLDFLAPVHAGDELVVTARVVRIAKPLAIMAISIERGGETVVAGEMKFFIDRHAHVFPPELAARLDLPR